MKGQKGVGEGGGGGGDRSENELLGCLGGVVVGEQQTA